MLTTCSAALREQGIVRGCPPTAEDTGRPDFRFEVPSGRWLRPAATRFQPFS
jgi:hypothetical protein